MNAEQIIELFNMQPLPDEGGYYVETYRAKEKIGEADLPSEYSGPRALSSAILYLITKDSFSKLHRLRSDEIFHFYLGSPVTMLQLHPNGSSDVLTLGPDILNGQRLQVVVPKNSWQGCFLENDGEFALMGCTVAPGFEFDDYQHADREKLLKEYPTRRELILKLTS